MTRFQMPGMQFRQKQADEQADNNVEDLSVYQLTYSQEEANLVAGAQSSMISYFQAAIRTGKRKRQPGTSPRQYTSP